jgi:hypothetical protein
MGPRSILHMDTGGYSSGKKSGLGVNLITPLFTVELRLSGLIGTASHPAMHEVRII